MLAMAPDYDNLTVIQKVEVFRHALNGTSGESYYLWLHPSQLHKDLFVLQVCLLEATEKLPLCLMQNAIIAKVVLCLLNIFMMPC